MAYETSAFGKADGSNVTGTVSTHFGAFEVGNAEGVLKTEGVHNEITINFDGDQIDLPVPVPPGAIVVNIVDAFATGAITSAKVGLVDISGADGTKANYVEVPLGGLIEVKGPSAGYVIVKYMHVAGT